MHKKNKKHKNTFPTIDDGLKGIKFIFVKKIHLIIILNGQKSNIN